MEHTPHIGSLVIGKCGDLESCAVAEARMDKEGKMLPDKLSRLNARKGVKSE
jgi:hypothetical protein